MPSRSGAPSAPSAPRGGTRPPDACARQPGIAFGPPAFLLLAALHLGAALSAASPPRPNILHIFADDQSARSIGAYGDAGWSWVRTPHTDRLAAEGVRFDAAYCGSWCVPSRAMLLTGLQPHAIRGFDPARRAFDAATCRFWPAELRAAGYRTAFVGKWHIKGYGDQALWARDWDQWFAWDHTREGNGGYYGEKIAGGAQRIDQDGRTEMVPGYPSDNYTAAAENFVRHAHDHPWYLWLCYGAPHAPYIPAERHRGRYADASVPVPVDVFGPRNDKPPLMREFTMWLPGERADDAPRYVTGYGDRTLPEWVRLQHEAALAVDDGVGRLLAALADTGQLENTIVVYSADNGFPWGEQGYANKTGPYEAAQRTPLIVRWPARFARGAVCRTPVSQLDLIPTFFAAAGVPLPWPMHGHDLHPLLHDPTTSRSAPVLVEYFNEAFGPQVSAADPARESPRPWDPPAWWVMLRSGKSSYIRWLALGDNEELYDLLADPAQQANVAREPAQIAQRSDLRRRLGDELRRTHGDPEQILAP